MVTKYFFNWSNEDFSQSYNSEGWDFKAGSYMLLKEHLADFFAKKLVDRELQKAGLLVDDAQRGAYLAKCFVAPADAPEIADVENASSEKLEAMIANAELKRKAGRPKKEKVPDEDKFEGLKEDQEA